MRVNKILVAIAVAALGTLGACTAAETASGDAPTGINRPASTAASEPVEEASEEVPEETPTPTDDGTAQFGETYTWTDGIAVTVSAPKAYKPSDTALVGEEKSNVVFTVTLVNNSGKTFDPSMFTASMQSGNTEAEEIFDSANDVGGSPMTKLLNKREAAFKIAFNVANPADLVMEVSPSFEHESVIFTS